MNPSLTAARRGATGACTALLIAAGAGAPAHAALLVQNVEDAPPNQIFGLASPAPGGDGGLLRVDGGSQYAPGAGLLNLIFGQQAGTGGFAEADGAGSAIRAPGGTIELGHAGQGHANLSGGAVLEAGTDLLLGTFASAVGTITAVHGGGHISAGQRLVVGGEGHGEVDLIGDGTVAGAPSILSGSGEIGSGGGSGHVHLGAPHTHWTMADWLVMGAGAGASGTLAVDGASVNVGSYANVGTNHGAGGGYAAIDLSLGAALNTGAALNVGVGNGAHGEVAVASGARVQVGGGAGLNIASSSGPALVAGAAQPAAATATGVVTVDGGGSSISTPFATVGASGDGTLAITSGARTLALGVIVGRDAGADGTLAISGQNSRLIQQGQAGASDPFLIVGREGRGVMNLLAGGRVVLDPLAAPVGGDGAGAVLSIGGTGSSTPGLGDGSVTVSGTDGVGGRSRIVLAGDQALINVGRQGRGELHVADGALVTLLNPDGASTVNIGRGVGPDATGRVTVASGGVLAFGDRLRVGHSASGNASAAGGTLDIGAGGYVGGREVTVALNPGATGHLNVATGGVLDVHSVRVNAGGTLSGGGTVIGNLTLEGGVLAPGNSPGTLVVDGDLVLVSGVLALEQGDLLDVSGAVQIGAGVMIDLTFAGSPGAVIDLASYFVASQPVFDPAFDGSTISVFAAASEPVEVLFGGRSVTLTSRSATAAPAPASALLLAGGLCLAAARRGARRAA